MHPFRAHRLYHGAALLGRSQWHLLLTALIATILALHSIPHNDYVIGGDALLPALNPNVALAHLNSTWNGSAGFGVDNSFGRALLFPFVFIDWLFYHLGVSPLVLNNGWVIAIVVGQATSAAWLFCVLFPEVKKLYSVLVGTIAIVNPYMLLTFHTPYPSTALSIAVFPAVLGAVIYLARRPSWRSLLGLMILSAIMATGDNNYGVTLAECLVMLPAVVLVAYTVPAPRARLRFIAVTALTFLAANVAWLLPGAVYILSNLASFAARSSSYSASTLRVTAEYSGLLNSGRLIGDYLFFNNVGGKPYIAGGLLYVQSRVVLVLSWALPFLALVGAVAYRRDRRANVVFGMTVVFLFFAKGVAPPFGGIFAWLVAHFIVLNAFRDSFSMLEWVVMYGYAILAGLALATVCGYKQERTARVVGALLFAAVLAASFPILAGQLFAAQALTPVPARYFDMAKWFNGQRRSGAVLEMPVAPYAYDVYTWGYVGAGLNLNLIRRPILSRASDFASPQTQTLDNAFQYVYTLVGADNAANILGLYGVRYVINDPSINTHYFSRGDFSSLLVGRLPGTSVVHRFGSIAIYEVSPRRVNSAFYAPEFVYYSRRPLGLVTMGDLCRLRDSCRATAFVTDAEPSALVVEGAGVARLASPRASRPGSTVYVRPALGFGTSSPRSLPVGTALPLADPAGGDGFGVLPDRVCASDKTIVGREFTFKLVRGAPIVKLSLTYVDATTNPILYVTTGSSGTYYQASLPRVAGSDTFVRVFDVGRQARTVSVLVTVRRQRAAQCATISRLVLRSLADVPASLTLAGSRSDYYATPLGVALRYHVAAEFVNAPLRRASIVAGVAPPPPASLVGPDTASDWTTYENLIPHVPAGGFVSLSPPLGVTQLLAVRSDRADVHQGIGGLVPGGRYDLSFTYRDVSGRAGSVAVLSQTGQLLLSAPLPYSRKERVYSTSLTVPPNSASVVLYVYLSGPRRGTSVIALSSVKTTSENTATYLAVSGSSHVARPRSIYARQDSATSYRVDVVGAPHRYLLVMNSTYSPAWGISGLTGATIVHIKVNGDENGWWIMSSASHQEFKVTYGVERWVKWGLLGSGLAGVLALILVIF